MWNDPEGPVDLEGFRSTGLQVRDLLRQLAGDDYLPVAELVQQALVLRRNHMHRVRTAVPAGQVISGFGGIGIGGDAFAIVPDDRAQNANVSAASVGARNRSMALLPRLEDWRLSSAPALMSWASDGVFG
jgi:hypothetical protein